MAIRAAVLPLAFVMLFFAVPPSNALVHQYKDQHLIATSDAFVLNAGREYLAASDNQVSRPFQRSGWR